MLCYLMFCVSSAGRASETGVLQVLHANAKRALFSPNTKGYSFTACWLAQ